MIELPLVSIGIPLCNEEEFIEETLKSVVNQSYRNIEILVSDNFSTDSSYEIAKEAAKSDDRIQLFSHGKNKGPFFNFKFLLDNSNGNYFMWLGGHDTITASFIEEAVEKLESFSSIVAVYPKTGSIVEGVYCDDFIHSDYEVETENVSQQLIKIIKNTRRGSAVHSVYRKEVLKRSFFDLNGGDLLIFLKAATYGRFVPSSNLGLYMRVVRSQENKEEQNSRYINYGFKPEWEWIRSMYPFEVVANIDEMDFNDKLMLLSKVRNEMRRYKLHSWGRIFKYHLKRFKLKTALLVLTCKLKGL
jgi:glycosyltransferase involved in cell wall biosynthesis